MNEGVTVVPQWLNKWNARLARLLWWVVLIGIVAALPVMYARAETESSAKQVAIVMDYRDLLQVSSTQADPQAFAQEQLKLFKQAGVNGMAVFESTLEELSWAGEVVVYNASQAALLEQRVVKQGDNGTYVLFNNQEHEKVLRPIIEWAFRHHGADITNWSTKDRSGLRIGIGYDDALIRPMQPNPLAMKMLTEEGFQIIPRLSDRFIPYDDQEMGNWMKSFQQLGVTRVVFDGEAVTGFGEGTDNTNLKRFANQLNAHKIGIAIFENLKVPQKGINRLASLVGFNAVRAHPVGEAEMATLKVPQLEDRLVLAVKDRNIRLLYLNATSFKDTVKGQISNPFANIVKALQGDKDVKGVVPQLKDFGYELGVPQVAEVHKAPQELILRGLAALGAFALIALTIGLFLPSLLFISLIVGGIGSAGLYVLNSNIMIQALALFAAIAAPTASVILLIRRLRQLRESTEMPISGIRRLGGAVLLFVRTTVLTLAAVPFMVALLNDITYSLVIQQFRGVGLLHLAPIGLVALYVFLYGSGSTVTQNARKILSMPLTVLWIVAIGIIGAAGLYYLTRTGNTGQVSGLELQFRSILENAFGVRPRTKEFLLGHPFFFLGIFLALRYRWAMVLLIPGTIAQLSMVDTFAHFHTPLLLSIIRIFLGLGIGAVIGIVLIAIWQFGERVWVRWVRRVRGTGSAV
jgi:hypothetical protein